MSLARIAPALFAFLWSTGWIAAKFGAGVAGPMTFLSVRFAAAAVLMFALCRLQNVRFPRNGTLLIRSLLSGALLHGLYLGAVWWAIAQGVPANLSGVIAALQPLLTAALAVCLIREKLSRRQVAGLLLGFAGVALAVVPSVLGSDLASVLGLAVLINILGMVSVSFGTIYQKQNLGGHDLRVVVTYQYVGALAVTLPFACLLETWEIEFGWIFWSVMAWSVVASSIVGVLLLLYLLRQGQASKAAALVYLVPALTALQALIAFREVPSLPMVIGAGITILGVYLTSRSRLESA
ncbi:DMT family transporter [Agrobacterium tumefaciens]|uniref:DMT family transporter n=1 Tax=Agrobacterium tumefaciens TaxID=358 RepID=UPI0012B84C17|nr:DMT family transporter [Agrobacterium tumefaciens]MQB07913.1 DMT family transporter [Agrobacterium tumefaciens]